MIPAPAIIQEFLLITELLNCLSYNSLIVHSFSSSAFFFFLLDCCHGLGCITSSLSVADELITDGSSRFDFDSNDFRFGWRLRYAIRFLLFRRYLMRAINGVKNR